MKVLRRGYTLIEMMVVVAVFSFVLVSASLALSSLWRGHADLQLELAAVSTLHQWQRQLRSDAHVAESAEITPAGKDSSSSLKLLRKGSRVEYTRESQRIVRTLYQNDRLVHREVYMLPNLASCSWTISETPFRTLRVSVARFEARLGSSAPPVHTDQIETAIGLVMGGSP